MRQTNYTLEELIQIIGEMSDECPGLYLNEVGLIARGDTEEKDEAQFVLTELLKSGNRAKQYAAFGHGCLVKDPTENLSAMLTEFQSDNSNQRIVVACRERIRQMQ